MIALIMHPKKEGRKELISGGKRERHNQVILRIRMCLLQRCL
jgi:hypothetical protein